MYLLCLYCELNHVLQDSNVKCLAMSMTIVGYGVSKKVLRLNEVIKVEPLASIVNISLREDDT